MYNYDPNKPDFGGRDHIHALCDIVEANSPDQAWELLERFVMLAGFDYVGVFLLNDQRRSQAVSLDHATPVFSASLAKYFDRGLDRIDPVVPAVAQSRGLCFGHDILQSAGPAQRDAATRVKTLMNEDGFIAHAALNIGLANETGYFALGFGNVADGRALDMKHRAVALKSHLRLAALAYLSNRRTKDAEPVFNVLSDAETTVIEGLALGATPQEVASIESKSLSTVRQQIHSARKKLGAKTVHQTVARATILGLIKSNFNSEM